MMSRRNKIAIGVAVVAVIVVCVGAAYNEDVIIYGSDHGLRVGNSGDPGANQILIDSADTVIQKGSVGLSMYNVTAGSEKSIVAVEDDGDAVLATWFNGPYWNGNARVMTTKDGDALMRAAYSDSEVLVSVGGDVVITLGQ